MKIPNPQQLTADDLLPRLQALYPQAVVRKPAFSKGIIMVQMNKWKMFVRPFRKQLIIDFQPPVVWSLVGIFGTAFTVSFLLSLLLGQLFIAGYLIVLLAFLGVKAIWKSRQRETIERFRQDVEQAASGFGGVL